MQFTPSKICTSTRFQAVLLPHLPCVLHSVSHSLSSSSPSQLLLYFTAIKPGNFNQVAQHEFLQAHERSELLFNAVVLSFLFSFSTSSLFSRHWTQPWLFIVYDSISNLSSRSIFLVGSAVLLFSPVCTTVAFSIHIHLKDTCISISNSASALCVGFISHESDIEMAVALSGELAASQKRCAEICIINTSYFLL